MASQRPLVVFVLLLVPATVAGVPALQPAMGLSVRSFGAAGDGITDDAPALQSAIDAAQTQKRTLLLPAGRYLVKSALIVRCCHKWGAYPHVGNRTFPPLRMVGEGRENTAVVSAPDAALHAVIAIPSADGLDVTPSKKSGPTAEKHHFADFQIQAGANTRYGVLAPLITRSEFRGMAFYGGTEAALKLGGWINSITECSFRNSLGFSAVILEGEANAIDVVRCTIEGNHGAGVLINKANNVRLTSNTMEGNGGPAVIANSVRALSLRSNYFEGNLRNESLHYKAQIWPLSGNPDHTEIAICADVIINSAPEFSVANPVLATNEPLINDNNSTSSRGVVISGNSHTVDAVRCVPLGKDQSETVFVGVLLASTEGVVIEANECGGCGEHYPEQQCVAVVASDPKNISQTMNVGWSATYASWDFLDGKPP